MSVPIDEYPNNRAVLRGTVGSEPVCAREVRGERIYESELIVARLSGVSDRIPFAVPGRVFDVADIHAGDSVTLVGQVRSHNETVGDKTRLRIALFAKNRLENDETLNSNSVALCGFVCKPPVYRVTPLNREICDLLIAVNRAYGKSDYIPCITWGASARRAKTLRVGDKIRLTGRLQSREYTKTDEAGNKLLRTAYEVSVNGFSLAERKPD